ncbi:MAG: TonB-dependent receptor, partial [Candidatus Delongbacteria bacterium]|nr:TonB-dependent receptor [Candidatus Delongbacteria bacterium]
DVVKNGIRDGGDAEGYKDKNYNGYFDREWFDDIQTFHADGTLDRDYNSNWDDGEEFADANGNGDYDGDTLYDSDGDNEWDYWEKAQSYNGFISGVYYNASGTPVTVTGTIYNNPNDIVEGYKDNNLSGHYDKYIYSVAGDEPFIDGDRFLDTGEPFVDHKRLTWTGNGIQEIANNQWDEGEENDIVLQTVNVADGSIITDNIVLFPDFWTTLDFHVSNEFYEATYDTTTGAIYALNDSTDAQNLNITITYPAEKYADLRSSLGSAEQTTPRFNDVYDTYWNSSFDEYEAFCSWRQEGSSTDYAELGWTTGHDPRPTTPDPVDYVEYIGSYSIYRAPAAMYQGVPNWEFIPYDIAYSTWIDFNDDGFYNSPNGRYDSSEDYVDYNYNGVRNEDAGFLLPDTYQDGILYQDFDNTVMKFKGNYTNQINKFHMIKTGFELSLNDLDYYSITNPFIDYVGSGGDIIDGDPYPNNGEEKTSYAYSPTEFSFYVQDKMEFEDLVVNAGIRLDLRSLDQDAIDYYQLQYDEGAFGYEEELDEVIFAISPRFGISHAISEASKLFFSYGHLYMKPTYTQVFAPNTTVGADPLFGNMNLGYERNVQYELGVVNELFSGLYLLDITGY